MKNKGKLIALVLVLAMLIGLLTACSGSKDPVDAENSLTINISSSMVPFTMPSLKEKFPDINFVVNEYPGSNASRYLRGMLANGEGGDIFYYTTFLNDDDVRNYLVNLSGYAFLSNLDKGILTTLDVDGSVYQIPGPITVRYMIANKTLFDEHGWKMPEKFSELVAVCRQIHEEAPEIVPLALGTAGLGYVFTPMTSYAQMGFLDTAEGKKVEKNYRLGIASFGDGFSEGIDMVGELIDAGAFDPVKFERCWDVPYTVLGNREAAMGFIMGGNVDMTKLITGEAKGDPAYGEYSSDEFVVFPYFGKNEKNKGLILGASNTWGINKRLEEKGNEKKLQNALRVLEFLTTEEGQLAVRTNQSTIPATKEVSSESVPGFLRELWNDNANSIKTFFLYTGYEHMMVETAQVILEAMKKGSAEGMRDEVIRVADSLNEVFLSGANDSLPMGYVEDNLTVEQTRRLSCEAMAATMGTSIGIASEGAADNRFGLAGKLFKGDVVQDVLTMIVCTGKSHVVSVPVTGAEIKAMLENGKVLKNEDGTETVFKYWSSGLDIAVKDGRITELKLNGSPIEDAAVYKVAMPDGDYSDEFMNSHEIENSGVDLLDSLSEYFSLLGTIKADK